MLLKEDEDDGGARVQESLTEGAVNKGSPASLGHSPTFSDPNNIFDLRRNFGASMFDKGKSSVETDLVPNSEEICIEISDENKRKRKVLIARGKSSSLEFPSILPSRLIDIDGPSAIGPKPLMLIHNSPPDGNSSTSTVDFDLKNGVQAGLGVQACPTI